MELPGDLIKNLASVLACELGKAESSGEFDPKAPSPARGEGLNRVIRTCDREARLCVSRKEESGRVILGI
jgi:hypothetical protein